MNSYKVTYMSIYWTVVLIGRSLCRPFVNCKYLVSHRAKCSLPFPTLLLNKTKTFRSTQLSYSLGISDYIVFLCSHSLYHVKSSISLDGNVLFVMTFCLSRFICWIRRLSCNGIFLNVKAHCCYVNINIHFVFKYHYWWLNFDCCQCL